MTQSGDHEAEAAERGLRSAASLFIWAACAALLFAGFAALGSWQLERRAWKLDLINRVDQRVHAPPASPPAPDRWAHVNAADDEYRHLRLTGTFLPEHVTLVPAATARGSGFWVLVPLRMQDGSIVIVNQGFSPPEHRDAVTHATRQAQHESSITGLLRMTEPGGGFLRRNDPAADRWYSRDVQAIARARGLTNVAPYFLDADAGMTPANAAETPAAPAGGLTVIAFHNNHLVYAITWYVLALVVAAAAWRFGREEWQRRHRDSAPQDAIDD
ncbi:SURF1 family protein [Xylophilus sp. ASV27]|uniref:SURF1 family protein n=1 Tax=Xylophilus sp. ASV27 TaxID=2795129 RepID=UPI00351C7390